MGIPGWVRLCLDKSGRTELQDDTPGRAEPDQERLGCSGIEWGTMVYLGVILGNPMPSEQTCSPRAVLWNLDDWAVLGCFRAFQTILEQIRLFGDIWPVLVQKRVCWDVLGCFGADYQALSEEFLLFCLF